MDSNKKEEFFSIKVRGDAVKVSVSKSFLIALIKVIFFDEAKKEDPKNPS